MLQQIQPSLRIVRPRKIRLYNIRQQRPTISISVPDASLDPGYPQQKVVSNVRPDCEPKIESSRAQARYASDVLSPIPRKVFFSPRQRPSPRHVNWNYLID